MYGNRDAVSDCAVTSTLIAVSTSILRLFVGIGKPHEPARVQTFGAELAVERLDERDIRHDAEGVSFSGSVYAAMRSTNGSTSICAAHGFALSPFRESYHSRHVYIFRQ